MKKGQRILLPCHEEIGEVVDINVEKNKAVIRVKTDKEKYDVITTVDGKLPHTNVTIAEHIIFEENENVYTKVNGIVIGKISNIRLEKNAHKTLMVADFNHNGETEIILVDECYKLFNLKKEIDKLCRENDKFIKHKDLILNN